MTLSPDDLAAMGEKHREEDVRCFCGSTKTGQVVCHEDRQSWPCDSRRLLDEVEALRRSLRGTLEHVNDPDGLALHVEWALSEEVMTQTANEPSTQQREGEPL